MKRFITALSLALVLVPASTFAESTKSDVPAYLLSIFLGFGTGHMYAESPKAGTFLWSEVGSIAAMTGGLVYSSVAAASAVNSTSASSATGAVSGAMTGLLITSVGGVALGVFRIWEIVDIFGTVDQQRKAGILASAQPELSVQPKGVSFTLAYHY